MRKEVERFADAMEEKLQKNDHKVHWRETTVGYLLHRIEEELAELKEALSIADQLYRYKGRNTEHKVLEELMDKLASDVQSELCDVGNFAMMMWDKLEESKNG